MFNRSAFFNSRPDGISVLEVIGDEPVRQFVPLQRTVVSGEVVGPLAALTITHTYRFSRADFPKPIEALYRFPLPGDAAVTGVMVHFGTVTIQTELTERKEAEATYEAAKEAGEQAALATRESPDVFTLRIAGLRPDEPIVVETAYVQLARSTGAGWSLRVPLTTAPRYVREDEAGSRAADGQPLALLRDPEHRFALDLLVRGGAQVTSATHDLAVKELADQRLQVRLQAGEVVPDRDCVLTWEGVQEANRPALTVVSHDDQEAKQRYFLALVAPPLAEVREQKQAREAILLIDHSGSMTGPKWAAADWATRSFLGGLTQRDTFALGLFHDTTTWFAREPRAATADTVEAATAFLLKHTDSGGTNLGVALEQALGLPRDRGQRSRHLLIVTDAEVSDAARILRLADSEAGQRARRRISVLCIDAAPNAFLATELAERGGGVSRFLTSAPEEDDITTALDEVLSDWAAPVLSQLQLRLDRPDVALARGRAGTDKAGGSTIDLGDLPTGRAIWVVGRVPLDTKPLTFTLAAGAAAEPVASYQLAQPSEQLPALKALFGARRVLTLEHLLNAGYDQTALREQLALQGYDPNEVLAKRPRKGEKVYAENRRTDTTEALHDLLVSEALAYGLASAETAFVAVRHEAGERIGASVVVTNALPAGWSPDFLGVSRAMFRQTGGRSGFMKMMAFNAPPSAAMPTRTAFDASLPPPSMPASMAFNGPGQLAEADQAGRTTKAAPVFKGKPTLKGGEAVLFDSTGKGKKVLAPPRTLTRLAVQFPHGAPDPQSLPTGLAIALYLDDPAVPRATVRLAELLRQGGERPLNLAWRSGQLLRVVLLDPTQHWATNAPEIAVVLA